MIIINVINQLKWLDQLFLPSEKELKETQILIMFTFSKTVCSSHHVLEHRFISKTTETLIESLGVPDKGGLICNAIFEVEIKSRNKIMLGLSHMTLNKYTI